MATASNTTTTPQTPEDFLGPARQEIAKRAGDYLPGFYTAVGCVGLENHRSVLNGAMQRVADSHELGQLLQAKAGGVEELYLRLVEAKKAGKPQEDDAVGDIIVTGDWHLGDKMSPGDLLSALKGKMLIDSKGDAPKQDPAPAPAPSPAPAPVDGPTTTPTPPNVPHPDLHLPPLPSLWAVPGWVKGAVAVASLGAAFFGGTAMSTWLSKPVIINKPPAAVDTDTDTSARLRFKDQVKNK